MVVFDMASVCRVNTPLDTACEPCLELSCTL